MAKEISKTYNPEEWEELLSKKWEESGFFNPDNLPGERKESFSTIMPPPNANGRLHVGHSSEVAIKDTIVRYKRMAGFKTLMVPGADHAGFETQIVFERMLEKEGRSRFDMSPTELYDSILRFTLENKVFMEADMRRLGATCDWSRKKFTLDPDVIAQVQKTFKKMFDDGLVYRGSRIVNWCSKHQTSLSDVETEFIEKKDSFYYLKYGPFVIATARPETKFGDKYVVMHPDDERYTDFAHGQKIDLEWINGPITATVIKDEAIDREFGTGVMTITPWHDQADFEIADRHGLDKEQIIDFQGRLLDIAGEFAGMNIKEARETIVAKLASKNLVEKIDAEYQHTVRVCYKCNTAIEPQIKAQWFVKMKPLAEIAMQPVHEGLIKFIPERFEKTFFYWMENTIDWNISRQIIWGIPIPAKICTKCHAGLPDLEDDLTQCPACDGPLEKDPDTFDTWFSSGQWPLVTLGYPESADFKTYYPTDLMETGSDLIFKWVPRMIIFGMYLAQEVPFRTVYFHGMVNDEHNQKMSKSKGNVVSPIDLSDQFGTDALRLSLLIGNTPGNNLALSMQKVETFRNFTNKLWNIGRYVLQFSDGSAMEKEQSLADQWILSRLKETRDTVTNHLENYQLSLAGEALRDFTWNDLADWYIEIHKIEKNDAILRRVFETLLRLWHPFMPFVTEALFEQFQEKKTDLLMIQSWPSHQELLKKNNGEKFLLIQDLITRVRNIRALYRIDPKKTLDIIIVSPSSLFQENESTLRKLARLENIAWEVTPLSFVPGSARIIHNEYSAFVHLAGAIDTESEKIRLNTEKENLERYHESITARLNDPNFTAKAPQKIIDQSQASLAETQKKIADITAALASLA